MFGVNLNYRPVRSVTLASLRFSPFRLNAAAGSGFRSPSIKVPRELVTFPSLAILLAYFGAHAVLGIVMKKVPAVATVHALLSLLVALYWAVSGKGRGKVITAICYLAGAEVLWRMAKAAVFWEYGKYAVCAVILVSLLRYRPPRFNWLPLLYFVLLLPSIVLTVLAQPDSSVLRQTLSSNLSGPFTLALFAFCLAGVRLRSGEDDRCLLAMLGPITGVAAVCLFGAANLSADYQFGDQSNFDTSGGFGPNQVSAVLGLGMLAGFLWMQNLPRMSASWWVASMLILFFAAQATLTFSRTGICIGVLTIGVASFFMMRASGGKLVSLMGALLVFGVLFFAVFRSLDQFTGGKLSTRYSEKGFSEKGLTGRGDIAQGDLLLAVQHPLLGVGPGRAVFERSSRAGMAAHTEFTRILAEHGLAGFLALTALLLMAAKGFKAASGPGQQVWTASLIAYSLLFMLVSGMRLAAPSVAMGLAMVKLGATNADDRRRRTAIPGFNAQVGQPKQSIEIRV